MKLIIEQSLENKDIEITIKCALIDKRLEKLIENIRLYSFSITGKKDNILYSIKLEEIFYFESIDDKTFIYCKNEIYECELKLYEIEEYLINTSFTRISKSSILNLDKLIGVKALLNGKLEATLQNKEKIVINRHYVKSVKEKLNR